MLLKAVSPNLAFKHGHLLKLPVNLDISGIDTIERNVERLVYLSRLDWDSYERSWDFCVHPILDVGFNVDSQKTLEASYQKWLLRINDSLSESRRLEEDNNKIIIESFGLGSEVPFNVALEHVTLSCNPYFRYGLFDGEPFSGRFREETLANLISYAIGCMMGRYSLDEPGLIYAHAGNVGFDPSRYARFPADADGILPVTDEHWFEDDAPARVREFLQAVWGPDTLAENLAWLAESLGTKGSETPEETIRRYIADKFYKDHLQTYKKRPIYWLFSSGKQGAFQALVYLHRYHEGTLARMRAEYVIPLSAKMAARLEMLEQDANAANSAAARTKVRKQIETLRKRQAELLAFDEKLRHYADMRITLDLDDGVKVNYGKFGDLLDSVKVVTGGSGDD